MQNSSSAGLPRSWSGDGLRAAFSTYSHTGTGLSMSQTGDAAACSTVQGWRFWAARRLPPAGAGPGDSRAGGWF